MAQITKQLGENKFVKAYTGDEQKLRDDWERLSNSASDAEKLDLVLKVLEARDMLPKKFSKK